MIQPNEKLVQLHREAIRWSEENLDDTRLPNAVHASLTADVAIKFFQWNLATDLMFTSDEEAFDYFINSIYKPE